MNNKFIDSHDIISEAETKLMYGTLIEQSTDGIILHERCNFKYFNPSARKILGIDAADEPQHYALWDFVADSDSDSIRELMQASIQHVHSSFRTTVQLVNHQGKHIDVEVMATSVKINGDSMIQAILQDVSQQNLIQEIRQKDQELFRALIGHLADRTLNPLTVIQGYLKLLREGHCNVDTSILLQETEAIQHIWAQIISLCQEVNSVCAIERHLAEEENNKAHKISP